jgi:hypothetical protein
MEKTWKPKVGGILTIICGSFYIVIVLTFVVISIITGAIEQSNIDPEGYKTTMILTIVLFVVTIMGIAAIIGGIFALRRKVWKMALAGAILSIVSSWIMGIIAVAFIAISRKEFGDNSINEIPSTEVDKDADIKKTRMRVAGGILNIICGAINIILGIVLIIAAIDRSLIDLSFMEQDLGISIMMIIIVLFMIIAGTIAIIGGINALHRKNWGVALAGAILSCLSYSSLLGVPSIILIALSRKEFH